VICQLAIALAPRGVLVPWMKKILLVVLSVSVLAAAGCSRSEKKETVVQPQSTPDAARLKADSERLQKATANAAKAREEAQEHAIMTSPAASPTTSP
jgi:hypothetical protein